MAETASTQTTLKETTPIEMTSKETTSKETTSRETTSKDLMITGSIPRHILRFMVPIALSNLFQQLYNAVDSIIVGNFVGSNALAAVSSSGNLIFMIVGFFNGIAIGAGVVIAHFLGARDKKNTETAVHTTVALGIVFSVLMTVIGLIFVPPILRLMGTPESVFPESVSYMRIYFAGSVGFVMYNVFVGILQAAGDSKHPLIYLIISSVVNIFLDLLLVAVFHFGVAGASFATVMSQVASAVLCMIRLCRTDADYRFDFRKIRLDPDQTVRIIKYGIPSGVQNSIMSLSNVVIQSYINSYGEAAVAGIGAYTKVEGFCFIPVTSFAMAITTFVSQNLGAGEPERARKGIRFSLICTLVSAQALGLLLFAFRYQLVGLFDKNPQVVEYGAERATFSCLFFFLCAFTHFFAAVMRGAGKPLVPMFVIMFCWCVVRVLILTITDPFIHTVYTTYLVYPVTWAISTVVLLISYRRLDLTKAEQL